MTPAARAALTARCRALLRCLDDEGVRPRDRVGVAHGALVLAALLRGQTPEVAAFRAFVATAPRAPAGAASSDFARCLRQITPPVLALGLVVWGETRAAEGMGDDATFTALWEAVDAAGASDAVDDLERGLLGPGP